MGFESSVDPDFVCRLCGKVLEDPLTTPCGHVFCAGCVIPWVDKQSSCPVKCQRSSTKELNHVLPMKNLILKLDIMCDNYTRGCKGVVKLQQLLDRVEMCDFSSVKCRNKGCNAVLSLKDMDSHMRETCEYRPVELCKNGCGLTLTLKDKLENHGCKDALRTQNCVLQAKLNSLERELRRQTIRSSNRERSLLAQLSTVHCELQLTTLKYQKKLAAYKARIDALSGSWAPLSKGEEARKLTVTLHRSSGPLGFTIAGGRSWVGSDAHGDCSDGIYVSKIMDNGPADTGGLQTQDKIMKVNGKDLSLATHEEAVEAFSTARGAIEIEVARRASPAETSSSPQSDGGGVDASTQANGCLEGREPVVNFASSAASQGMVLLHKQKLILPTPIQAESYGSTHGSCSPKKGGLKGSGRGELYYEDDGQLEEDENCLHDDFTADLLEQNLHQATQFSGGVLHQRGLKKDGDTSDMTIVFSNRHEKDSGVEKGTDESTRNDESSEQENLGDDQTSTSKPVLSPGQSPGSNRDALASRHVSLNNGSFLSVDGVEFLSEPAPECECFQDLLELKCLANEATPNAVLGASARPCANTLHSDCEEQEVQMLSEELRNIDLKCMSVIQAQRLKQEAQGQQPSWDSAAQLSHINDNSATEGQQRYRTTTDILEQMDRESSSAYNTEESSPRSSPVLEFPSDTAQSSATERSSRGATTHRHQPIPECSTHILFPIQETITPKTHSTSAESGIANRMKGQGHSGRSALASPPHSPYKHAHIPAHAQHYRSYMQLVQQRAAVEYSRSRSPQGMDRVHKAEWKSKIHDSSTRHLTRRPGREELRRERALRVQQERCGTTTDEEVASEIKAGRYWSKEERRRHVAQAREQRLHRELARQGHREQQDRQDERQPDLLQLSHRKMMKKRNKKILDNWMTIQELLTHGVKSPDGTKLYSPLLSVTTV